ncbi:MAG: acyloxyacyl hydrolase [Bacteroidota bacterium]|nr:acyloxyacyl hydrolase [Bacteroidota bacterium]
MLLLVGIYINVNQVSAQTDTVGNPPSNEKLPRLFAAGLGVQHGFIFPHSKEVQNTKGARPTGVEFNLNWQSNDAPTWNLCHCYPRQGLLLAFYDYDIAILGKGVAAAYLLEPTYRISNSTFVSLKGAAGLAYLSNPFDSIQNPTNQSYSTAVSGYLLFGVGAWYQFREHWWLNASANYQHVSNGGMKKPNKGINWPTFGLTLVYQPELRAYYSGVRTREKFWRNYSPRWDISVLGSAKRGLNKNNNRVRSPLLGIAVQGAKQVGRISTITLGTEVYHDEELRHELNNAGIGTNPVKAGVMLGHEFILGKFLFSQRLGYYLFNPEPNFEHLFHRWGLHYRINQHFGFGFNLLAHSEVADFIDLRIAYSFQKFGR